MMNQFPLSQSGQVHPWGTAGWFFDVGGEIEQSLQIMDGSVPLDGLRNKLKLFPLSTESLLYDTFRSY